MDNKSWTMPRLILVPQYPAKLRYQEWWFTQLPLKLENYFDVHVLGKNVIRQEAEHGLFSNMELAIEYETRQIKEYSQMELYEDDILLLCDLSYPGLFANVLFHKRPKKCFAICHATSKNGYDYFMHSRSIKYPVEKHLAGLFQKVFVGSHYHKQKLGWSNTEVLSLPLTPGVSNDLLLKDKAIVSVARPGIQKRTTTIERTVERIFKTKIEEPLGIKYWDDYFNFLKSSEVLLITGKEETFGYQVVDAILNNCVPLAPNHFSYPELLPKEYLYDTMTELVDKIISVLDGKLPVPELLIRKESENFYTNLVQEML